MENVCTHDISIPQVSVIIPVYNTAPYLCDTLDSICNQTLRELEIILINDGSTDGSPDIMEQYARKDPRIQCHSQPNQGLGVARNNGLLHATGEYIYFMDSDDLLEKDALRQCYELGKREQLDLVTFDADIFPKSKAITNTPCSYCRKDMIDENKIWNGPELLQQELEQWLFITSVPLLFCNHIFLKKIFAGFPAGIIHEDHIFTLRIMLNAKRIRYTSHPYFKRRIRPESIMTRKFSMRNIEGYTQTFMQISSWKTRHKEWETIINLYLKQTINSVIWLGHQMTFLEKVETYCRIRRLKFSKYVTLKNWIVFWFKPTPKSHI